MKEACTIACRLFVRYHTLGAKEKNVCMLINKAFEKMASRSLPPIDASKRRKRRRVAKGDDDKEKGNPATMCPICIEPLDRYKTVASCDHGDDSRHIFHRECLTRLFMTDPRDRCPNCRRPCIGLRAELVADNLRKDKYKIVFALLTGGITADVGLSSAQKDRAIALLGTALGCRPDDTRFQIVITLVIKSLRHADTLGFLVVVMEAFGIEVDEVSNLEINGTPLQWFAERPRPTMLSAEERYRAVRVLLALGADPVEVWLLEERRSGSARIDMAIAVAYDVRRAILNIMDGDIDRQSIDHISNIAFVRPPISS